MKRMAAGAEGAELPDTAGFQGWPVVCCLLVSTAGETVIDAVLPTGQLSPFLASQSSNSSRRNMESATTPLFCPVAHWIPIVEQTSIFHFHTFRMAAYSPFCG